MTTTTSGQATDTSGGATGESARWWMLAGAVVAMWGLGVSELVAALLKVRESPVVAVAEEIVRLTPGEAAEAAIGAVGQWDKPLLGLGIVLVVLVVGVYAGRAARRASYAASLVFVALAVVAGVAVIARPGALGAGLVPVAVGCLAWLLTFPLVVLPLRWEEHRGAETGAGESRRVFLIRAGVVGVLAVGAGTLSRVVSRSRRAVEAARKSLDLQVSAPRIPAGVETGLDGVAPWMTPADEFYLIDTVFSKPTIDPADWSLRIHGLVEKELTLSYDDLVARELTESWVTLNCVSNPVGGDLVGNAWWSGVRIADILAEVGLDPSADAVLQTSDDGWNCATPIGPLTDERDAMLVVAMNGKPLPVEHGFPVRTVVPGLYGYVSATKWLVDMEVTRFADVDAFWTQRGWSELGPVKIASRIDVPRSGANVASGQVKVGGSAWMQHTGVQGVQVQVDGGKWTDAEISKAANVDTWVQWQAAVDVGPGEHQVRVRAVDATGEPQTGVERGVLPDGATGWHTVGFTAG